MDYKSQYYLGQLPNSLLSPVSLPDRTTRPAIIQVTGEECAKLQPRQSSGQLREPFLCNISNLCGSIMDCSTRVVCIHSGTKSHELMNKSTWYNAVLKEANETEMLHLLMLPRKQLRENVRSTTSEITTDKSAHVISYAHGNVNSTLLWGSS